MRDIGRNPMAFADEVRAGAALRALACRRERRAFRYSDAVRAASGVIQQFRDGPAWPRCRRANCRASSRWHGPPSQRTTAHYLRSIRRNAGWTATPAYQVSFPAAALGRTDIGRLQIGMVG